LGKKSKLAKEELEVLIISPNHSFRFISAKIEDFNKLYPYPPSRTASTTPPLPNAISGLNLPLPARLWNLP
jgi:hypothetical protein